MLRVTFIINFESIFVGYFKDEADLGVFVTDCLKSGESATALKMEQIGLKELIEAEDLDDESKVVYAYEMVFCLKPMKSVERMREYLHKVGIYV